MTDQARKYLFDIISSIELIEEFISGIDSFEEFERDI
jgi:uncharacterized protein with HEPN domain